MTIPEKPPASALLRAIARYLVGGFVMTARRPRRPLALSELAGMAAAYQRSLATAAARWTDDPPCPPPPVTAVAEVTGLDRWELGLHVEGVHGYEWHDLDYETHVWEAARCLKTGHCGG